MCMPYYSSFGRIEIYKTKKILKNCGRGSFIFIYNITYILFYFIFFFIFKKISTPFSKVGKGNIYTLEKYVYFKKCAC